MAERFFETLMNDEVISSSLSQIGLLSLIFIVSFILVRSVEKDSEKHANNKKEEAYACDDGPIVGFVIIFAFTISSLFLVAEIFRVLLIILLTFIGRFA